MPKIQQGERERIDEDQRRARQNLIGHNVLLALGAPNCLHLVQVKLLWDDRYRVNILVGDNAASAKVAHSFFLVADSAGNIVMSTPKIAKLY